MASSVAAGGPLGIASLRAILWDLQACITEPARIIYYCSRDIARRLIFHRETGRERASVRCTGKETVSAAVKGMGTAEKESPPVDEDEDSNQQHDDDDDCVIDYAAECGSIEDDYDSEIDYSVYLRDDSIDNLRNQRIGYYGDSIKIQDAYSTSRYLVELLAVRPRFNFVGKLHACDSENGSFYYCFSQRGEICRNLDSQGNLILHAEVAALQDNFYIEIKIPEDDDGGFFSYTVDPHACNHVIRRTISTAGSRKIDLVFIPMHTAIQANVEVTLDLISGSAASAAGTIYYVDGEISAHHQFYNNERVVLFSRREEDKVEVINGKLPLSRNWAAVPISLEPVLIIKLNLRVRINHDHDGDGNTISFRGDVTFYHDQYEKTICSAHHGEVKVQLSYY